MHNEFQYESFKKQMNTELKLRDTINESPQVYTDAQLYKSIILKRLLLVITTKQQ